MAQFKVNTPQHELFLKLMKDITRHEPLESETVPVCPVERTPSPPNLPTSDNNDEDDSEDNLDVPRTAKKRRRTETSTIGHAYREDSVESFTKVRTKTALNQAWRDFRRLG